jgi:phage-related protein
MNGALTYNTNSLQTFNRSTRVGINTNIINHTDIPASVAELYIVANANDSEVPNNEYPNRLIQLAGTIHGSTQADLDDRIDTFKGYFAQRYKNLDITYGSGTRRYVSMKANALGIERQDKALFAKFSVELICKPFGIDTTATNILSQTAYATATKSISPTIGGTAPFQLPIFTFTLTTITGAGDYIQITNNLNSQEILIYGLGFVNGDVLVIDCAERVVTLNGDEVDYNGSFLELEPGASDITISDGFTTRSINMNGEYSKRWL